MSWLKLRLASWMFLIAGGPWACAGIAPETGAFVFKNFAPKDYSASPQNWAIAQDSRGVMYFGNSDGVLEFDGVFWRLIRLSNRSGVRALATDSNGRIYVGGQGVFGYLAPNEYGSTQFVPIAVPKEDADFNDVWNVLPASSGVYFGAKDKDKIFFRSNGGEIRCWRANTTFGRIFIAHGEIFATTGDRGLQRLQNDYFVDGPTGNSELVHGAVLFAPGEHPLIASRHGLYNFALSEITPFANASMDYLSQSRIFSIQQLANGSLAVGTRNGGLVLLDKQGKLERVIRKEDGLLSDWVTAIYQDRQQGIWLATDSGLTRFIPTLSNFGESHGLQGSVIAAARQLEQIYIGTTRGAFKAKLVEGGQPTFEQIGGLPDQVFSLAKQSEELLAGGDHGLYRIVDDKAENLMPTAGAVFDINFSRRDPSLLFTAGADGLRQWLRRGSTWKSEEPVLRGQELRTVLEDSDGRVWATTDRDSIWRIDFSTKTAKLEQFTASAGVPVGAKNAYLFHGHVVFATESGLLQFSERSGRFEPDPEIGTQYSDKSRGVSIIREGPDGSVWVTGPGYHAFLERDAKGNLREFSSPLIATGADVLWSIFVDADGTCWASGQSTGLFRLEKLDTRRARQALPALLRRVGVIGGKEAIFAGDSAAFGPVNLDYDDNALRFEFAAPFYEAPNALEYRFQLEGNEKNWSNWTKETHKDYTNLFEGSYRFRVSVRDPHGSEGGEASFPFEVRAPFYRTWWAYGAYVFAFLFAGWLILRWRLNALKAKNRWLEGVVEERTAEVRKERDENEALLLNILPRPVAAELRTKGEVKPTTFDDVTVCFSDFVGFTLSSEKMPAEQLITSLNEYFTVFDEIIGRYGLEKLKTIGDAYMFAGGLPSVRPSHGVDSVLAALEMTAAVNRLTRPDLGVNWKIRLGLYSGPVVAGVVGVRKFAFDIWGNTVNFAARMESAGQPGRVNLSETTFKQVEDFIQCESRGGVAIKEGRKMEMYFAIGPKPELQSGPRTKDIPEAFRIEYEKAFGESPRSFPSDSTLEYLR